MRQRYEECSMTVLAKHKITGHTWRFRGANRRHL
jgi:hypothetical protein